MEHGRVSTDQIILRPIDPVADLEAFRELVSDPVTAHFLRTNPNLPTRADVLRCIKEYTRNHPWLRVICLYMDGPAVGLIFLSSAHHCCRLGFIVGRRYWKQGIATAAAVQGLREVFTLMPRLMRVEGLVDIANRPAKRVLEKVGFLKVGVQQFYDRLGGEAADMAIFRYHRSSTAINHLSV